MYNEYIIKTEDFYIASTGHYTAEGPLWDPYRKVFFYTDIEGGTLHKFDPCTCDTYTWQIGTMGNGDKNGQMIGGMIALNNDGSLILMLENGANVGVNYFNPDNGTLLNIPNSWPETDKNNRPNDATVVDTDGGKRIIYGTMNKQWAESGLMEGAFYILDRNMHSHQIKFNGTLYPGTIISNGLADGGKNADGSNIIFWAESVGTAERLNVYRGNFCSKTNNVKDIRVFATHTAITDGAEGRPDGANMVNLFEKAAYAVSVLQIGEIRIFDCQLGTLLAKIKLPHGMTNNTKFAIGQDKQGRGVMFVTSLNFDYGNKQLANSLNGSTGMFLLPSAITLHSASIQITDYPSMEEIKTKL